MRRKKKSNTKKKYILSVAGGVVCLVLYYVYSYIMLGADIDWVRGRRANAIITMSLDQKLGAYYVTNEVKNYRFDSEGYPEYFANGENHRHPTQLVQIGLQRISMYMKTGDSDDLAVAKKYADYLAGSVKVRENQNLKYGLLSIDFFNRHYPFLGNSWISGLLQGQTLSLMLRMYQVTGNEQYKNVADLMYESYKLPHDQGGFAYRNGDDLYFDECVSEPPTHILNGHIYAVMGLLDYWRVYRKAETEEMLADSVATVERKLAGYTVPGTAWSYYDDPAQSWSGAAGASYHNLHPILLRVLAGMTSNQNRFLQYADFWETAFDSPKDKIVYLFARDYFRVLRILNRNHFQGIPYPL
ncbi:MAG TPA: D-glucuronyl C5-epimerase family protein [Patescibacteria group bacterium]|nr:D-glucuronyl C5-epimerase family protein [Patescibacteria group bacterium]